MQTTTDQGGVKEYSTNSVKTEKYFNSIFDRMCAIKPAWKQGRSGDLKTWPDRYKQELSIGLKDGGVKTKEQIEQGVSNTRLSDSPFLPSVGEFVKWCLPEGKGWEHSGPAYKILDKSRLLGSDQNK